MKLTLLVIALKIAELATVVIVLGFAPYGLGLVAPAIMPTECLQDILAECGPFDIWLDGMSVLAAVAACVMGGCFAILIINANIAWAKRILGQ